MVTANGAVLTAGFGLVTADFGVVAGGFALVTGGFFLVVVGFGVVAAGVVSSTKIGKQCESIQSAGKLYTLYKLQFRILSPDFVCNEGIQNDLKSYKIFLSCFDSLEFLLDSTTVAPVQ